MVDIKDRASANILWDAWMNKYGKYYPEEALRKIEMYKFSSDYAHLCVMTEIYVMLGFIKDENNPFKIFRSFIEEQYGLDRDILEVACGHIPTLALDIDLNQQKRGSGSIEVCDDALILTTGWGDVVANKRRISEQSDVSKFSLIVSMLPCEATKTIIKVANKNEIEMVMYQCGCVHDGRDNPNDFRFTDFIAYRRELRELASDTLPKGFIYSEPKFPSSSPYHDIPIVMTKRKKD